MPPTTGKPLAWLHGEIRTPPFSAAGRVEAGVLLRRLQNGEHLGMPHSRPMPSVGPACHELRIPDTNQTWRLVYFLDRNAIVILEVFPKKTRQTPLRVLRNCQERLSRYLDARGRDHP